MKIIIKICAPFKENFIWGDTSFAINLSSSFKKLGHETLIHFSEDINSTQPEADVLIFLAGLQKYSPENYRAGKKIIWMISHPEIHDKSILDKYDYIMIASEKHTETIRNKFHQNTFFLPQVTDPVHFNPSDNIKKDIDVLFVGNNYYTYFNQRKIIYDLINCKRTFNYYVVGKNWERGVPKSRILMDFVDYSELPKLYSRAKIVLNDHHETMRRNGFVNNRTFDLANLKVFQISDKVEGLEKFGIVTYDNPAELGEKIEYYLNNDKDRERISEINYRLTRKNNFDFATKMILETIKEGLVND